MNLQNEKNGFLFKSRDEAMEYGKKTKQMQEPERIAFLTERLIKVNTDLLSKMQTNVALYHDACMEFVLGDQPLWMLLMKNWI